MVKEVGVCIMRNEYDFSKARRAKKSKEIKVSKTVRLDPEVLEWLEVQGANEGMGYQTFLNWFLRNAMKSEKSMEQRLERLEKVVLKKAA
jgi:uncharacterized protein (DUF4415 family)